MKPSYSLYFLAFFPSLHHPFAPSLQRRRQLSLPSHSSVNPSPAPRTLPSLPHPPSSSPPLPFPLPPPSTPSATQGGGRRGGTATALPPPPQPSLLSAVKPSQQQRTNEGTTIPPYSKRQTKPPLQPPQASMGLGWQFPRLSLEYQHHTPRHNNTCTDRSHHCNCYNSALQPHPTQRSQNPCTQVW